MRKIQGYRRRACAAVVCILAAGVEERRAEADDLFEINVFHARVNQPGQLGVELHSNYVARGVLARERPEASAHHVLFEMLEPSIGLAKGWEAAIHLGLARRPDGSVDAGILRSRFMGVAPLPPSSPLKLAVNIEGGYANTRFEPAGWTGEIRPVIELVLGDLDVDLNPVVSFAWTRPHAGVPRLAPCASVRYTLWKAVDVGVEYYADFGPVSAIAPLLAQQHYVFEAVELVRWPEWALRLGVGEGLTAGSNPIVVTTRIGRFF